MPFHLGSSDSRFDPKEIVTTEEIAITNMVEVSALIELLIEKGIVTQDELMER
jgi:hypothetical protein